MNDPHGPTLLGPVREKGRTWWRTNARSLDGLPQVSPRFVRCSHRDNPPKLSLGGRPPTHHEVMTVQGCDENGDPRDADQPPSGGFLPCRERCLVGWSWRKTSITVQKDSIEIQLEGRFSYLGACRFCFRSDTAKRLHGFVNRTHLFCELSGRPSAVDDIHLGGAFLDPGVAR